MARALLLQPFMDVRPPILIVDDEHGPREALRLVLTAEFEVETCASAGEALERLRSRRFAVVLLDLTMPGDLSGIEILREIRRKQIPVEAIMLTGNGSLDSAVECLRLRAFDYVAKPFGPGSVLAAVRAATEAWNEPRRARESTLGELSHEVRAPLQSPGIDGQAAHRAG